MSDFLDNLIAANAPSARASADARANANANTIRPYLPSRFESFAPAPPDLMESVDVETDAETTSHTGRASVDNGQHDGQLTKLHVVESLAEDNFEARRDSARVNVSSDEEEGRDARVRETSPASPLTERALMKEPLTERVVFVEREVVREVEPVAAPPRRRADDGLAPSTLLIVERHHEVEAHDASRQREGEESAPSRGDVRRSLNATPGHSSPRPESVPEVHVTIGRVEVRASQPSQPARPARRNAPQPMTLEEYQRRRTSGDDR